MKILFLCGSVEPGRDGVGDYTRRLSGELIRQGHDVRIIGLSDKSTLKIVEEIQFDNEIEILTLRISKNLSDSRRFLVVKEWIKSFQPDWLSLQYVPFSFHDKGIPIKLTRNLQSLCFRGKWHIMFHEIWVKSKILKLRILFFIQRILINKMIEGLNPATIHTHLPLYYKELNQAGWNIKQLPLFSNINFHKEESKKEDKIFKVCFFSQADAESVTLSFLNKLKDQISNRGQRLEILFIGGDEKRMRLYGDKIESLPDFHNTVKYTGFISSSEVSKYIQSCNLAITPVPYHVLGKSGSVAAFLSHGIPVSAPIVSKEYGRETEIFFNKELQKAFLIEPDLNEIYATTAAARLGNQVLDLSLITKTFLKDLQQNN